MTKKLGTLIIILLMAVCVYFYLNYNNLGVLARNTETYRYFISQPEHFILEDFKVDGEIHYIKYDTEFLKIDFRNLMSIDNLLYKRYIIGMKIKNEKFKINGYFIQMHPYTPNNLYVKALEYDLRYLIVKNEEDYTKIYKNKEYMNHLKDNLVTLKNESEIKDEKILELLKILD